jgi:hypothetical protein
MLRGIILAATLSVLLSAASPAEPNGPMAKPPLTVMVVRIGKSKFWSDRFFDADGKEEITNMVWWETRARLVRHVLGSPVAQHFRLRFAVSIRLRPGTELFLVASQHAPGDYDARWIDVRDDLHKRGGAKGDCIPLQFKSEFTAFLATAKTSEEEGYLCVRS